VAHLRWLLVLPALGLFLTACDKHAAKKPDPTKGVVTGIVLCADTGKPARFATVTLSLAPKKEDKDQADKGDQGAPLPSTETAMTDLDGRFRMEAVEPGRYYAFATLEGYLDPMRSLDFDRIDAIEGDRAQEVEALSQWKDHITELSVHVHRTSEITLEMERGAEIGGTVSFDDGSPAAGMHFELLRKTGKTEKPAWANVGLALLSDWSLSAVSDGHGRFSLTNLPAGEYKVCAMMPVGAQDSAARVCLGNVFRRKDAKTVKVSAGEIANGLEIVIPLSGLHKVEGTVSAIADGKPVGQGAVQLLYADDREKARETRLADDGTFSFDFVAEGKYIVAVIGAQDAGNKDAVHVDAEPPTEMPRHYADKEAPVTVIGDVDDLQIGLPVLGAQKPQ
jgi:hypothetical protein